jgi:hypothetical protein
VDQVQTGQFCLDLRAHHLIGAGGAGLVTAAAMAGVSERIIMLRTGHKNIAVLRRYIREGSAFRENAAAAVGL